MSDAMNNNNTDENLVKPDLDKLGRSYATGKRKNASISDKVSTIQTGKQIHEIN